MALMNRELQSEQSSNRFRILSAVLPGGLLFGLPLLIQWKYEVGWFYRTHPLRLLIYVLATFTLLLGLQCAACGPRCDTECS